MRNPFLPLLAFCGLLLALFMVFLGMQRPPTPPLPVEPPLSPYKHFVAGSGIIESSSENIAISTPFSEIVDSVSVVPGMEVAAGSPLFTLNQEILLSDLAGAKASFNLALQKSENAAEQFQFFQQLKDKRAVSAKEFTTQEQNLKIAISELEVAKSIVNTVETKLSRSTIKAPFAGRVLEVNIHPGEIANTNGQMPLILFGAAKPYFVRVDIDEVEAWRIKSGAKAVAYLRGNSKFKLPLHFIRIEPYIKPKTNLTGDDSEKIDTRVLQVIFRLDDKNGPLYPGELVDVYIDAGEDDALEQ